MPHPRQARLSVGRRAPRLPGLPGLTCRKSAPTVRLMNTSSAAQAITPATVRSQAVSGRAITPPDVAAIRARYSSLRGDFVYLDAPGGTQTPDEVAAAVARVYLEAS